MVVGDVHGQYFDLLNILKKWRPDHSLLFLGDYVGESNFGKWHGFNAPVRGGWFGRLVGSSECRFGLDFIL